jgi:putative transposase
MTVCRAATFRLYPTDEQAKTLAQFAGACRFIYNLALEQRRDWWRPGRTINAVTQGREVTQLRALVDWLRAVPVEPLHQAIRDLDRAYQNWWSGRAEAPTPRRKGVHDSFRLPSPDQVKFRRTGRHAGQIKIPKMEWMRLRGWRPLPGELRSVTISRRAGKWFASFLCRVDIPAVESLPSAVGIDLGVKAFAALSTGEVIASPNFGGRAAKAIRRAQRVLARKKPGSENRAKAAKRLAAKRRRVTNARKDFLHKVSTTIAQNHGLVVVEALKVRSMAASASGTAESPGRNIRRKAGLNRSILEQGWRIFRGLLAYKLTQRGGQIVEVAPAYTSQTCSACGVIDPANRKTQANFACVSCGHAENADINASRNILAAGLAVTACGGTAPKRPNEAGTRRSAA